MAVVGGLLVGIGVGMLFGNTGAGSLIGLGVGLIIEHIFGDISSLLVKRKYPGKEKPQDKNLS